MNQQGITKPIAIVIISVVVLGAAGTLWYIYGRDKATTNDSVACTQDAMLCPDGSYVGRTGPDCEFAACPATNTNSAANTNTGTSNTNMTFDTNTSVNTNTSTTFEEYPISELLDDYKLHSLRIGRFVVVDATVIKVDLAADTVIIGAGPSATDTVTLRITDDVGSVPTNEGQGYVIYFSVASPTADPVLLSAGQPSPPNDGYNY